MWILMPLLPVPLLSLKPLLYLFQSYATLTQRKPVVTVGSCYGTGAALQLQRRRRCVITCVMSRLKKNICDKIIYLQ